MTQLHHGFRLMKTESLPDIQATAYHYHHVQSGGEVVWLKTDDANRTFGIGFKTPPQDSTGVAHIVEHTVLSGSRKYPVKDPFMQMVKSSMSTFLNAMTFADMTCFPVSSMNEEDFHQLMDVYLDAVFFPNVLTDERIFRQEGWHKELFTPEETMRYNGIVYNEMRGEYSSADRMVSRQIQQYAHPNSTYANESGGYPYAIPTLTYEDFVAFYRRYYRPDNALVGLYGDIDIDRTLAQIDGEFFSAFTATGQPVTYTTPAWDTGLKQETVYYHGDRDQTAAKDTYLSYTVPFGTTKTLMDQYRLGILMTALVESEAGPLQQALVETGYAQDLYINMNGGYYLDFSFVVERMDAAQAPQVITIIEDTLQRVATEGVDTTILNAVANTSELLLRKLGGSNRGLTLFIQMLSGWRYRQNPTDGMHYQTIFKQLRSDIASGAFTAWVKESLVHPTQRVILLHEPKVGLFSAMDQQVTAQLSRQQQAMSTEERQQLMSANQALKAYQQTPDTAEALATLPQLQLADIERTVTTFSEERQSLPNGGQLLYHPQPTNGVRYFTIALSLDHLDQADLPYVSDLMHVLGTIDTKHHTYQELEVQVAALTNGIQMQPKVYAPTAAHPEGMGRVLLSFSALQPNTAQALALLREVLLESQWQNQERLRLVFQQLKSGLEEEAEASGHRLAMERLQALLTRYGCYRDLLSGVSYYDHVVAITEQLRTAPDTVIAHWQRVLARLLSGREPVVSLTSEPADQAAFTREAMAFVDRLLTPNTAQHPLSLTPLAMASEGLTSPGNVQYVAMGNQYTPWTEHGKWRVLGNLMSNEILYEQLRLEGGAYGEGFLITSEGIALAYSYRDPHLDRTLHYFEHMADSLRAAHYSDADLERLIIGTLTSYQYPLAPQQVDSLALNRYFRGMTTERLLQRLDETLQTSPRDLKDYVDFLVAFAEDPKVVVYGNQEKLHRAQYAFGTLRPFKH